MEQEVSFQEHLYASLAEYLRRRGVDAVEVTGYTEDEYDIGYCSTCSYLIQCLDISYLDSNGDAQVERIDETLADLMRDLP